MEPIDIFKVWCNMDIEDYLVHQMTKDYESAASEEDTPSRNTYTDEHGFEYSEDSLDIVKNLQSTIIGIKDAAETSFRDLAIIAIRDRDLYDLLENVFFEYIPRDIYNKFHKIIDDFDTGVYSKEEKENMKDLSKDRETFLSLFGL